MNVVFLAAAALMAIFVTVWLCRTLWRGPAHEETVEQHAVNTAVLRDQLSELKQDHANGILSPSDLADAQAELQRRVLEEAVPEQGRLVQRHQSKRSAIALAILLPLAASLTYLSLGSPEALTASAEQASARITPADVQTMVNSLEARLAQSPDDPEGWLMLARSHRYFGNHENAALAFAEAASIVRTNPLALAEYADSLAKSSETGFQGEPTRLLELALALNPRELFALTVAGAAALERRDSTAAIDYWNQLLAQLPADSNAAKAVKESIEHARLEQSSSLSPPATSNVGQ
ncbi:MAG: c-type cytochrome biogenesis protein CcmI [Pigmentiphaga sp.]